MTREEWEKLIFWCEVRAVVTGSKQRIYPCRIGDVWHWWSTAASAGYHGPNVAEVVRREAAKCW